MPETNLEGGAAKSGPPPYTDEALRNLSRAAVKNAERLLRDAGILLAARSFGSAYFLAVASIEEMGKAVEAFDATGRNYSDQAVARAIDLRIRDHRSKIGTAFHPYLISLSRQDVHKQILSVVELMIDLSRGREPSMYVDVSSDCSAIHEPGAVVRSSAARDCVRLAEGILPSVRGHISQAKARTASVAEDRLFAMRSGAYRSIMKSAGIFEHFLDRIEADRGIDFAEAFSEYLDKMRAESRDGRKL